MKIICRACPFPSSNPPPVHANNKYELIKLCLASLEKAKRPEDEVLFILDAIPDEWLPLFTETGKIAVRTNVGNLGTFHEQLQLARSLPEDTKVLLLEDDYLWRPDTIKHLDKALDILPFISPYDHPSHYLEPRFEPFAYEMKLIGGNVYRKGPSNTLTFASTTKFIKEHWVTLMSNGINDHNIFSEIGIWQPTHSFATHMVANLMAPNVDWPIA